MPYKMIYHCGDEIGLKTKTRSGRLNLDDKELTIVGPEPLDLPIANIRSAELFRFHGLGRMLKIVHSDGSLFVSVVRFCLFDMFAMVNFFKTGALRDEINRCIVAQR